MITLNQVNKFMRCMHFSLVFLISASALSTYTVHAKSYSMQTIVDGLDTAWSMAFLPEGGYLLAFRNGELRRLSQSGEMGPPISNVPATYFAGQGGYFDVILDSKFSKNQTIYLSFAHGSAEKNATRVISATLDGQTLEDVTPVFTVKNSKDTAAHYGGRLLELKDGTILLTTGDGFEYREAAQDPNSQLGKIVRFNKDGSIPADRAADINTNTDPYVFTLGHRSPQGLAIDPESNTIFMHEHGPKGGDEVNVVVAGENYGWPATSYGVNYSGARVSPFEKLNWVKDALHYWTPSIAPSGMTFYNGNLFPDWKGDLLIGALVNKEVRRLDLENGKVVGEHILFSELDQRVRSIYADKEGIIYILTESGSNTPNGKLIRVTPDL